MSASVRVGRGADNLVTGQVVVGTSAVLIAASRPTRRAVIIQVHGTVDVYIGASSGVTTANGFRLKGIDGAVVFADLTCDIYAIVGAGSVTVSYMEIYD